MVGESSMALIRPARLADLPFCAAIINAYIDVTEWLPRIKSSEQIAALFNADLLAHRLVLVAEVSSEIVGYASFDPGSRFLPSLYLKPSARCQGIGRALLSEVKRQAPGGFSLTVWQQNSAARRFYQREGLRHSRDGVDADGLPVWHMEWIGDPDFTRRIAET